MKRLVLKSVLPVVAGIFNVLLLLELVQLAIYKDFSLITRDVFMLKYFIPASALVAMVIQYLLVIPVWERFKAKGTFLGLSIIPFTGLVCLLGGVLFALVFWERDLGLGELLAVFLTGLVAFTVYLSANILFLKRLDR